MPARALKMRDEETPAHDAASEVAWRAFGHSEFGFDSAFVIRISDFGFRQSLLIHLLIPIHRLVQSRHLFRWHDLRAMPLVTRLQSQNGMIVLPAFKENALEGRLAVGEADEAVVAVAGGKGGGENDDVAGPVFRRHAVA